MKKILSIFIAATMILSACPVLAFLDVPESHWAAEQINIWSGYGVISGYNGMFSPDAKITRGDFAVVLNKLMAYEKTTENTFTDLPEKYYTASILKLNKAGVMQGYEGKISPEDSLTREEAAIMICRALGIEQQDSVNKSFSDYADVSSWAKGYINAAVNLGLLNGAGGKLNPKNTITRAEVVTILNNAVCPVVSESQDHVKALDIPNILVISKGDVIIDNCGIDGKIIITQGVTSGEIIFRDSEINGEVVIDNDRQGFIKLENTTVADESILENNAFTAGDKKEEEEKDDGGGSGGPGGGGPGGSDGGKDDDDDDDNAGGNEGGNTGDDNTGDNEGGNTGDDNTGDNEGGNTGDDNTGDNEGGNTGDDNTGDNEGGNTGDDNTGDNEGGNTGGDNTGDNEGGNGDNTPDEPEMDADDYKEINAEMVANLQLTSDDIALYIDPSDPDFYSIFTNEEKYILRKIKSCIDEAITYDESRIINAKFIKDEYDAEITEVKGIYDQMKAEGRDNAFHSRLFVNLNSYTLFWLAETLGIDLSEYGINPGDYIIQ